jgi:medium-chain acyl-[acyl-carrier-protein] hydrolase
VGVSDSPLVKGHFRVQMQNYGTQSIGGWFSGQLPDKTARVRVFCFPYAGLGSSIFRTWIGTSRPEISFCPVQLPGRETRELETPFRRMDDLVAAAAEALEPHLDEPFALFGHSLGGLIAFELARRVDGRRPLQHLFVSARRAPHLPDPAPAISHLADHRFIQEMQRRYNGIPQAVLECPEILERLLPRLRADVEILETYVYRPGAPLSCPVSVFGGRSDATVSEQDLREWQSHTTAECRTRLLDGPHLFLQERRGELIDAIAEDVARLSPAWSRTAVR